MSLSELLDDTDDSGSDDSELSGLAKLVNLNNQKEKFDKAHLCPICGSDDTEKEHYYWRCNNDGCDTVTYIHTDFKVDRSKFW